MWEWPRGKTKNVCTTARGDWNWRLRKAPCPAIFKILIDNESNMATNLAQQHSIVATAGACPTKLSNILSDELDKMSRRNNEIGEHFVRWTWQNVPTKLANILSDELDKISDEITKLSLSQTQKNRYPKLRKRFLFLNCKYTFDPCFILDVYLNCFFRNSMIKHQIQCLQKCQKLKYLNRQK